jgi:hypothetical protein
MEMFAKVKHLFPQISPYRATSASLKALPRVKDQNTTLALVFCELHLLYSNPTVKCSRCGRKMLVHKDTQLVPFFQPLGTQSPSPPLNITPRQVTPLLQPLHHHLYTNICSSGLHVLRCKSVQRLGQLHLRSFSASRARTAYRYSVELFRHAARRIGRNAGG